VRNLLQSPRYGCFFLNTTVADDCSEKMYNFFMSLKQKDGSFMVAHHSEVDVRYVIESTFFFLRVEIIHVIFLIAAYIVYS
jgi:prenyltransferase beta subunit